MAFWGRRKCGKVKSNTQDGKPEQQRMAPGLEKYKGVFIMNYKCYYLTFILQ